MTYSETIDSLRPQLVGDFEKDSDFLRERGRKFAEEKNADGLRAVEDLINEIMPEEQKEEVRRLTHMDGKPLNEIHSDINRLINDKEYIKAKELAKRLYSKITEEYYETENAKFVSLRNLFEDTLYYMLYKPTKTLNRAPFDFGSYLSTYGYILVETGSVLEAIPVLEKAIDYNPIDCGPKFELAEVYKLIKNKNKLLEVTRDTLRVASSPVAIARCYANLGYMCFDFNELDDAVAFYTASVMFAPHPAIPVELKGIAEKKGEPIKRPSHEEIMEVFGKYDIEYGPSKDAIAAAAQLSVDLLQKKNIGEALKALKLLYNLTLDERVKDAILKYDPNSELYVPEKRKKAQSGEDTDRSGDTGGPAPS